MKNHHLTALIISGLLSLFSCGNEHTPDDQQPVLRPVKYATVGYSQGQAISTFSGIAQAEQLSKLSFRVGGTIRSLSVKLGDRVRKGQIIASIDPIDYSIQADQASASAKGAEANLQAAETQLIIARSNYQRIEKLYENNSVPLSDFEQAKSNFESAQSQYNATQTQLTSASKQVQAARNQVNYTRLTAPFSGIITAVNTEVNELVGSGTPIAEISSEKNPEINVGIPENYISSVKKGQNVSIHFSVLSDQNFDGEVTEVSYAAGSSPTYPAIIRVNNPSSEIRPGMAASVTFRSDNKDTATPLIVCPVKALGKDSEGNFVYILEDAGNGSYTAKHQLVTIGDLIPGGFEVKSGLKEGQQVVTAGLKSILDGMQVQLLEE